MKKNLLTYIDEKDLFDLFKIIWNHKIKILLITIISFFIGLGYSSQLPNNYKISLTIKKSDSSEFIRIHDTKELINTILLSTSSSLNKLDEIFFKRFIYELKDYKEFIINLNNSKNTLENISNLSPDQLEVKLLKYANLLEFVEPKK